jgi:peroxiredoxin
MEEREMTETIERDYTQAGPAVGERFADVRLPDQSGVTVDLHRARHGKKALIVFHRSAKW